MYRTLLIHQYIGLSYNVDKLLLMQLLCMHCDLSKLFITGGLLGGGGGPGSAGAFGNGST